MNRLAFATARLMRRDASLAALSVPQSALLADLSETERRAIAQGTARRVYRLSAA